MEYRVGDVLVCKEEVKNLFTKGKKYVVTTHHLKKDILMIDCDMLHIKTVLPLWEDKFSSLRDCREEKMKRILNS